MVYFVDIDNTICQTDIKSKFPDYKDAKPFFDRIDKINRLYENGNTVVYWTARGTLSGIDWFSITKNQLDEWGAKYHNIMMGKPYYDIFIDDKAINSELFFK